MYRAYYFYESQTAKTAQVQPLNPSSPAPSLAAQPKPSSQQPFPNDIPKEEVDKKDEAGEALPRDLCYLNSIDSDLAYPDPALALSLTVAKGFAPTFVT
ncbi:hypothetical protein BDV93DRAFT_520069 [Ceratobasidium sp. AG-I]|nr:hypothetical protein BDV93DRAFT_520069 [Ceratobasidium sp. AG-I]